MPNLYVNDSVSPQFPCFVGEADENFSRVSIRRHSYVDLAKSFKLDWTRQDTFRYKHFVAMSSVYGC